MSSYDKTILNIKAPTNLPAVPNTEYFVFCDGQAAIQPYILDPYYHSTPVLLHFDGDNDSSSIVNNGTAGSWWCAHGDGGVYQPPNGANIGLRTEQKKFGTASFWQTSNRVITSNAAVNTYRLSADFTVDFWFRPTADGGGATMFSQRGVDGAYNELYLNFVANRKVQYYRYSQIDNTVIDLTSTGSLTLNAWNHIALTRQSGTMRLFLNGNLDQSFTDTKDFQHYQYNTLLGARWAWYGIINFQPGYYDEWRINNRYALYTQNFTPRTDPYPNSSSSLSVTAPTVGNPTLPTTVGNNCIYHVKNVSNQNTIVVSPAAGQTIENVFTSWTLRPFESISMIANGTDWEIF